VFCGEVGWDEVVGYVGFPLYKVDLGVDRWRRDDGVVNAVLAYKFRYHCNRVLISLKP
jgi:hypothetical protein